MKRTIGILVSSIIVGLLGGMLGAIIAGNLITTADYGYKPTAAVQQQVLISYDAAAKRIPDIKASIVKLILEDDNDKKTLYGVSLSTDGWIAMPGKVPSSPSNVRVIDSENNASLAVQAVQDPGYDIWYAKVNKLALKPVDFLDQSRLTDNLSGVLAYGFQSVQPMLVTGLGYPDDGERTNIKPYLIDKRHNYEQQFSEIQQGLGVFSDDGKFIGFTAARGIIPAAFIRTVLTSLFTKNDASRPNLPILYRDVSWEESIDEKQGFTRGARLEGKRSKSYPLVTADGNVIRLHGGDIIKSVDQEPVDRNRSLTDILQQYQAKTSVNLVVEQEGETFDYSIIITTNK